MAASAPGAPAAGLSPARVGMVIWLSSELMLFAALFGSYFTLRNAATGDWPPVGVDLDLPLASVLTAVLVASSATVQMAERAAHRGDRSATARWLLVTVGAGSLFLLGQGFEWSRLGFGVGDHSFRSLFYTLTGFHGLHLIGGVVALAVVAGWASRADFLPTGSERLTVAAWYWHLVDVVSCGRGSPSSRSRCSSPPPPCWRAWADSRRSTRSGSTDRSARRSPPPR